jgi:Bor protein
MRRSWVALLGALALTAGCFHATITTGLAPSSQVIDEQWANGFIYGLVPPSTVDAASKCPHGVAQVETQHSFLNMLASFLTFDLYTPMEITVTCSTGAPANTSGADVVQNHNNPQAALQEAAQRAVENGQPVYVQF